MAGHSKFKNIMHRKGAQDKRRASIFARMGREISIAAREGGGDPNNNHRLRAAISSARAANMSKDNIERAIERASGVGGESLLSIRYEGFGPSSIAVIVECITDNRNRSVATVRSYFTKHGGNLGAPNSVAFLFERVGEVIFSKCTLSEDQALEAAAETGASDFEMNEEPEDPGQHSITFYTKEDELGQVTLALEKKLEREVTSSQWIWTALSPLEVKGEDAEKAIKFLENLEELDDVQSVSSNIEVDDSFYEAVVRQ